MAKSIAAGRVAYGLAMLLAPVPLLKAQTGETQLAGPFIWLARIFGIRDAALGAGALYALTTKPDTAAPWVWAGAGSDLADALVAAKGADQLGTGRSRFVTVFAATVGISGAWAATDPT